jgi:hypothetical protein
VAFNLDAVLIFNDFMLVNLKMQWSSSQVAMNCFPFNIYYGEKKGDAKGLQMQSLSGLSNNSTYGGSEVRRTGSELNSLDASDNSTDSLRRNAFPNLSQRPSNLRVFTVSELKSATKNFGRSVMLGEGGFGCVYKGLIKSSDDPPSKIEVAVKQLGKRGIQARFCMLYFPLKVIQV